MEKKLKLISAILTLASTLSVTAYANPADFHAKYKGLIDMYSDLNSRSYVVDINNDAVPELLCLRSEKEEERTSNGYTAYELFGIDTAADQPISITGKMMVDFEDQCFYLSKGIDGTIATSLYRDRLGRIYIGRYDDSWHETRSGLGWEFTSELMYFDGQKKIIESNYKCEPEHPDTYYTSAKYFKNPQNYAKTYKLTELMTVSDSIGYTSTYFDIPAKYPSDPWSTWIGPAVMMNGALVRFDDAKPYIANDRTMIPMRKLFELLGAEVAWNDQTKTATSTLNGNKVSITIGQNKMYVNGREVAIDAPAQVNYDRTYVPLRAISEALNATIEWDGSNKVVYIEQ